MKKLSNRSLIVIAIITIIVISLSFYLVLKPSSETSPDGDLSGYTNLVPPKKLIVLISLDGLGSNLINEENTPYLESLFNSESTQHTLEMQTLIDSRTMPSHISMVTGLNQEHHGFTENKVNETTLPFIHRTIFDDAIENGFEFSAFVAKEKLLYIMGDKESEKILFKNEYSSEAIVSIDELTYPDTENEFLFVHLGDIDFKGHKFNWESDEQIEQLQLLDKNLKTLIEDMHEEYEDYQRYIMISADHGGEGNTHINGCEKCRTIPFILITKNTDFTYDFKQEQYDIYDIACVAKYILGLPVDDTLDCQV